MKMWLVLLACQFTLSSAMAEIVIEGSPEWGFDGRARVGDFNLLTINIANDSDQPWEGSFELSASFGITGADIPQVQPGMFIEGYGRRRLQFLVFLPHNSEYLLKWGRNSNQRYLLDEPNLADAPAIIQMLRDDAVTSTLKGVATFEEGAFPGNSGGLNGLGTVLLDHVPRWSEVQQQAFADWLYAGGEIHLYQDTAGTFPEFPAKLAELNEPADNFAVGSGRVRRFQTTMLQSTMKYPKVKKPTRPDPEWRLSYDLFAILKDMTQPKHNWALIYLMAILYLLLLFPGCWLLGRKRGDYRLTYGAILGIVALFSFGFHTVGSRGYGESTTINSLAIAEVAEDGRMVTTQWTNLFVTGGGTYEVKHKAEGQTYSTGQLNEPVKGLALNRPAGTMLVDVPSFSARTIVHNGVVTTSPLSPEPQKVKVSKNQLDELKIGLPDGQAWPHALEAYAIYKDRIYTCQVMNGLVSKIGSGNALVSQVNRSSWQIFQNMFNGNERSTEQLYGMGANPLIAHDLHLYSDEEVAAYQLADNRIRVYIYGDMPTEFYTDESFTTKQAGRVLYTFDIPAVSIDE